MGITSKQRVLTQARLKELVHYDLETGLMTWKRKNRRVRSGDPVGCVHKDGYLKTMIDGRHYLVHRLAYLYMTGSWPDETDHVNGIRDDNRWNNLRSVSRQENIRNTALRSRNTSGVCGVFYNKRQKQWLARISVDRKAIHLGSFDSKEQAARARKEAEKRYGFSERHGKAQSATTLPRPNTGEPT